MWRGCRPAGREGVKVIGRSQYTPEHEIFRRLLRDARQKAGFNQSQLGEKVGLSQLLISRGELGDRKIDALELRDLCKAMGVSIVEFMRELDEQLSNLEQQPHAESNPQPERTRRPALKKRP